MSIPLVFLLLLSPDSIWTVNASGCTISVSYAGSLLDNPVLSGMLGGYAFAQADAFRTNFADLASEYPEPMPWNLEISFTHEPSPNGLICALAWIWEYSGGAHGNSWTGLSYSTRLRIPWLLHSACSRMKRLFHPSPRLQARNFGRNSGKNSGSRTAPPPRQRTISACFRFQTPREPSVRTG